MRRLACGTFPPASSISSSIAAAAMPSATAQIASASSPNTGNAYSGPSWRGRSLSSEAERSAGTLTPDARMSWLPVPRSPDTDQVSITSTSAAPNSISRTSGAPLSSRRTPSPSATRQPPISQSQ